MKKLFVAIELPDAIRQQLMSIAHGVAGASWRTAENLHVTIRYIGAVDRGQERDIAAALTRLQAPPFDLTIAGVGFFPPRQSPNQLWAGAELTDELKLVRSRVEAALATTGIERETRKFHPHITLARLVHAPDREVARYIAEHALFRLPPIPVDSISLLSSWPGEAGPEYESEEQFPLRHALLRTERQP